MLVSVLMSLYLQEKPEYVIDCFESLLNQTVPADEWVIIEDGPLTEEMYSLLDNYQKKNPGLIKRYRLENNKGLGIALREGVKLCRNNLIARMDTDDVARNDRFEKQLDEFKKHPDIDICGSHIIEFDGAITNEISKRKVPLTHDEIVQYQKIRSAFNHMTVMFKKSAVLKAGNYEHCPFMEDDFLWTKMIITGAKCSNIDDYLVWARAGLSMIKRRSGWRYFLCYKAGKNRMKESGFINEFEYVITVVLQFVMVFLPYNTKSWVYRRLLRK